MTKSQLRFYRMTYLQLASLFLEHQAVSFVCFSVVRLNLSGLRNMSLMLLSVLTLLLKKCRLKNCHNYYQNDFWDAGHGVQFHQLIP